METLKNSDFAVDVYSKSNDMEWKNANDDSAIAFSNESTNISEGKL